MRTLIVGIGALGGLIAAPRLRAAGSPVWLATRYAESAARLKASGLRVTGVGGAVSVETVEVAPLDEYLTGSRFDLVQELLRHANSRITLDLYAQAGMPNKRLAQSKLVRMVLNKGEALA